VLIQQSIATGSLVQQGGLIQAVDSAQVILRDTLFSDNTANVGGCVSARGEARLAVSNCSFHTNKAVEAGGALFIADQAVAVINDSRFNDNWTHKTGGAVSVNNSATVSILNSRFLGNRGVKAGSDGDFVQGGALFASGTAKVTITSTFFYSNSLDGKSWSGGGAVCGTDNSTIILTGCDFLSNVAHDRAGAVHAGNFSHIELHKCNFTGNKVTGPNAVGAAVDGLVNAMYIIVGSHFQGNINENDNGGAISLNHNATMTVHSTYFISNKARAGPVSYTSDNTTLNMSDCVFMSNEAEQWGGAVFAEGNASSVQISSTTCKYNTAGATGGCLLAQGNCKVLIQNSILEENTAPSGGVLLLQNSVQVSLDNVTIAQNR
jgi:hypothetical protein